jgi:hypothetical protein
MFNATFSNFLTLSWRSVFLVEKTTVPGENHRPPKSLTNKKKRKKTKKKPFETFQSSGLVVIAW